MTQHGGKELSYLNLFDTEAAWRLVQRFDEPACVIVKHANPCGVAVGRRHRRRLRAGQRLRSGQRVRRHRRAEPHGAGRSRPTRSRAVFTEVVVAPGVRRRRARRCSPRRRTCACSSAARPVAAAARRAPDRRRSARAAARRGRRSTASDWRVVTSVEPTDRAVATTSSSPGRCARRSAATPSSTPRIGQAFGIGAGQQNRLDSARIAAERSAGRADGGVVRQRRVLPVPRRPRRRGGRRDHGGDPARRQRPRRRGDRRRRRARHRHGLHRRAPLPPLNRSGVRHRAFALRTWSPTCASA